MKITAEEILKKKISVTNWNFLEHVLHSGEVYKQILEAMEEFAKKEAIEFSIFCLDYDIKNKAHELSTKELYEIFKNQ